MTKLATFSALLLSGILLLGGPRSLLAHHSLTRWNTDETIELEGRITAINWRFPHSSLRLEVVGDDGSTSEWALESGSINELRMSGVSIDSIGVGDLVHVAGLLPRSGGQQMFARNMLLSNGVEVLLGAGARPHWSDVSRSELVESLSAESSVGSVSQDGSGLFRVWSTVLGDRDAFPMFKGRYPLRSEAQAIREQYDASNPFTVFDGCRPKGMPFIMVSPFPMEFIDRGESILLHIEEYDTQRVIHMNDSAAEPGESYSLLGYSRGAWDGNTLVVETSRINAEWFDGYGTPQSENIAVTERFTLSDSENRLDYTLHVVDSDTFTEPFDLTRYWAWQPGVVVQTASCDLSESG